MTWRTPLAVLGLIVMVSTPSRADVLLVPYMGQAFSGVISEAGAGRPTTYGVRLEWLARGFFGVGVDFSETPDFLADAQGRVRYSSLQTLMGNVIIGGPLPAQRGFRPYLSGGIGVLSYDLTRTNGLKASKRDFGYNFGLGVSVLFSRHVGAELDLRYLRNTRDFTLGGLDFPEEILGYARWSGGLVLRF